MSFNITLAAVTIALSITLLQPKPGHAVVGLATQNAAVTIAGASTIAASILFSVITIQLNDGSLSEAPSFYFRSLNPVTWFTMPVGYAIAGVSTYAGITLLDEKNGVSVPFLSIESRDKLWNAGLTDEEADAVFEEQDEINALFETAVFETNEEISRHGSVDFSIQQYSKNIWNELSKELSLPASYAIAKILLNK